MRRAAAWFCFSVYLVGLLTMVFLGDAKTITPGEDTGGRRQIELENPLGVYDTGGRA